VYRISVTEVVRALIASSTRPGDGAHTARACVQAHAAGAADEPVTLRSDYADFFADFFFVADFFAADFFLADFFRADLDVADFFAADFFAEDFLAGDFLEGDFFDAGFFVEAFFFDAVFFPADFFDAVFFGGTFAPARRASDRPMAIACFRLLTFLPEPPLRSVPSLRSCMTFLTFACAFFPYFAISLLRWAGMSRAILHQPRYRVTCADPSATQMP
jgi:hypothetical protein